MRSNFAQRIIVLNPLSLHEYHSHRPMLIIHIDRIKYRSSWRRSVDRCWIVRDQQRRELDSVLRTWQHKWRSFNNR